MKISVALDRVFNLNKNFNPLLIAIFHKETVSLPGSVRDFREVEADAPSKRATIDQFQTKAAKIGCLLSSLSFFFFKRRQKYRHLYEMS